MPRKKATEQENIPDTFQILFVFGYLIVFKSVQFFPCQEDYLLGGGFQFRFERIVCYILVIVFLEAPSQEPFEESHLFTDGTVSHVFLVTQEIDILVQSELIEIFKGHIFLELLEVIFYGCKLFVCGFSPVVLWCKLFFLR